MDVTVLCFDTEERCIIKQSTAKKSRLYAVEFPGIEINSSLRSKRFRLVSEQRKSEEWDFLFWPRGK